MGKRSSEGVIERVPGPGEVRQKLLDNLRENRLLRRLLRVAESAANQRQHNDGHRSGADRQGVGI